MALPVADFNRPIPADLFGGQAAGADWPGFVQANVQAAVKWLEGAANNLPIGAKRLNSGDIERWDGTAWVRVPLNYLSTLGGVMSSAFGFAAGTVTAPGLYVTGDDDTGIYSPNANNLAVTTAGAERVRVDAVGRVGLNCVPANAALEVRATGGFNAEVSLQQYGAAYATGFSLLKASADAYVYNRDIGSIIFGTSNIERVRISEAAAYLAVGSTNFSFSGTGRGLVEVNGTTDSMIGLKSNNANIGYVQAFPGAMIVGTTNTAHWVSFRPNGVEKMVIDGGGNVGIGTSAFPFASAGRGLLEINGASNSLIGFKTAAAQIGYLIATATDFNVSTATGIPLVLQTAGATRMFVDQNGLFCMGGGKPVDFGNVGLLTLSHSGDSYSLFVYENGSNNGGCFQTARTGTAGSVGRWLVNGSVAGSITHPTVSTTNYNGTSDRRLKTNVQPAADSGPIIDGIEVVQFDWTTDGFHQRAGFIAQDLYLVVPEAVLVGDEGEEVVNPWGLDPAKLVPLLVKEVQSLRSRVAALEGATPKVAIN